MFAPITVGTPGPATEERSASAVVPGDPEPASLAGTSNPLDPDVVPEEMPLETPLRPASAVEGTACCVMDPSPTGRGDTTPPSMDVSGPEAPFTLFDGMGALASVPCDGAVEWDPDRSFEPTAATCPATVVSPLIHTPIPTPITTRALAAQSIGFQPPLGTAPVFQPRCAAKASCTASGGVASASYNALNRSSMGCPSRMLQNVFSFDARL